MWVKKRHKRVIEQVRWIFALYFKHRYNLKITNHKELKGRQFLVLANHTTTLDPFMVGMNFPFPLYYMTNADLFINRFAGGIIRYLVNPIPKNKSKKDIRPILDCKEVIKEGGSVCVFPEGNRTYGGDLCYIDSSIVKLIRFLKVDLCIVNICGGYGTDPRWSYNQDVRKGTMTSDIKTIIPYADIEKMNDDDLYNLVIKELDCNHNLDNCHFKSKTKAEGLERVFYKCPVCGNYESIYTKGNNIYCRQCHLSAEYTEDLQLKSFNENFSFKRVNEWYNWQLNELDKLQVANDETFFSDEKVTLFKYKKKYGKKVILKNAYLGISLNEIALRSKKGCYDFKLTDIDSMTALGKAKLNFYVGNDIYQLKGKPSLSVLKYLHYFYKSKHMEGKDNGFWGL